MVSTRKKRQSNKKLLSQLDDFDQDMINGNTANERQESVEVNEGTNDRDFTVGTSNVGSLINENVLNVKTLERCFNKRIDREMCNIVDTVEDRIQNAILTAIDNIVAPKIELAIRSINASSGRDVASASGNSERREYEGINASFENASENNRTLGTTHINDETRCNSQVSELPDPGTQFDRQSPTHYMPPGGSSEGHHVVTGAKEQIHNRHYTVTGQIVHTNQIPEFLTGRTQTPRNPSSHQYQNLSTQVSQDNNLPVVEQTPEKSKLRGKQLH